MLFFFPINAYCQITSSFKFDVPKVELIENDSLLINELKSTDTSTSKGNTTFLFIDDTEFYINFPGGEKALKRFLKKNLSYPDTARALGVEGVVYVSFLVNESGVLSDIKVEKGISIEIDKEVIRVVSIMPKWKWDKKIKPKNSKFKKVLPIKFSLN